MRNRGNLGLRELPRQYSGLIVRLSIHRFAASNARVKSAPDPTGQSRSNPAIDDLNCKSKRSYDWTDFGSAFCGSI